MRKGDMSWEDGRKVENERDCSSGNLCEWLSKLRFSCANLMEV